MDMDFNQAMESMQSMFPHFDYDTIKTVLASNDGHVERTIEDLMKLTEEAENGPDDDNLFADTTQKSRPPTASYNTGYKDSTKTRQEEEDAKMAYQLQLKYMQQEQAENQAAAHSQASGRSHGGHGSHGVSYPQQSYQGDPNANPNKKKPSFYKNLKVGLNKLFQKKKKGATKNPGVYTEIEPADGDNLRGYAQQNADEDDDSPMPLADALGQHNADFEDENRNQGGYKPSGFSQNAQNQGSYNQGGYNQGGYNQGGYNQGGYNQGGSNQGGFNQGGYNQGGSNQGGYNQQGLNNRDDEEDSYGHNYRQSGNSNTNTNHNSNRYPGFD